MLKQLTLRFGPLSDAVQEQVRSASSDRLDLFAKRIISAPTLDDVLK